MSVPRGSDEYEVLAGAARRSASQHDENPGLQDALERLAESFDRLARQVRHIRQLEAGWSPERMLRVAAGGEPPGCGPVALPESRATAPGQRPHPLKAG